MGKKNRLKRRKYELLRHEFVSYVCSQCGLCKGSTDASFCYDGHYTENPKKFIKEVLKALKEIKETLPLVHPAQNALVTDVDFEYTLEEAFCAKNLCGKGQNVGINCEYQIGCLQALRSQVNGKRGNLITFKSNHGRKNISPNKNKKQKRQKKNYVPPSPKFFCNTSFRPEVDKIINGNHIEQQDKGETGA